jgi:hypothetical protein
MKKDDAGERPLFILHYFAPPLKMLRTISTGNAA